MINLKSFEQFLSDMQCKKGFDRDSLDHFESASIIHKSVKVVNESIGICWMYKSASLALIVLELIDSGLMIEEIAADSIEDGAINIYYCLSDYTYYAVIVQ